MAKSILIINEDEEKIKELQNFFAAEGSTVFCVKTVDDAIACFANNDLLEKQIHYDSVQYANCT